MGRNSVQVLKASVEERVGGVTVSSADFIRQGVYPAAVMNSFSQSEKAVPRVAILMCTFHGQNYLPEQLDSFAAQTHKNWELWTSDDGSKDDTHAILMDYLVRWGPQRISLHSGPGKGFVANFLSLACNASVKADYYAFSDQDDIWEADKLERAVAYLQSVPENIPAIYCSRTRIVDFKNEEMGLSPLFTKPPSFEHALMQNIGGGNTMVFNNAARKLLLLAGQDVQVITHDWWAYLAVMASGGQVYYDSQPTLRYRQHGENLVGSNIDFVARLARIRMLWQGRFKTINDQHICALERISSHITDRNRVTLQEFRLARSKSLLPRLVGLMRAGIHRQTPLGNIGIWVAALFKKM